MGRIKPTQTDKLYIAVEAGRTPGNGTCDDINEDECAYRQQTMDEITALRQQVDRFNQQYKKLQYQQQPRQPLQRLDGNNCRDGSNNNNDPRMSNLRKGGQQQVQVKSA